MVSHLISTSCVGTGLSTPLRPQRTSLSCLRSLATHLKDTNAPPGAGSNEPDDRQNRLKVLLSLASFILSIRGVTEIRITSCPLAPARTHIPPKQVTDERYNAPINRLLLISTLGNRDITVDGHLIPQDDLRTTCEALLAELEHDRSAVLTRLGAPILERIITWVLDRHADPDDRPRLRIYLIASNPEDERFRHTDTMPAARLLQAWLPDAFGKDTIERVSLWRIDTNPADYDDAIRFFVFSSASVRCPIRANLTLST